MLSNLPFKVVPIALTVPAIRPFSIAVGPDSSFRNVFTHCRSMTSCGHVATKSHFAIIRGAGLASLIPSTEGHNSP
jgi:hypothetical protein